MWWYAPSYDYAGTGRDKRRAGSDRLAMCPQTGTHNAGRQARWHADMLCSGQALISIWHCLGGRGWAKVASTGSLEG